MIEEILYPGPFDHERKLKVGDIQRMAWVDHDGGPYYMSEVQKEEKKYDKSDGQTREVVLNMDEMMVALRSIGLDAKGRRND